MFTIYKSGLTNAFKKTVKVSTLKVCTDSGSSDVSLSTPTSFFKKVEPTENEFSIAAKEATFAFHTAMHDISFETKFKINIEAIRAQIRVCAYRVRSDHQGSGRTDGKR